MKTPPKVTIYSTSSCHFCKLAKEWFDENEVKYIAYDVGGDKQKREEMVKLTGQMGVPVITIGDDTIIGFNESVMRKLLGLK